jgi:hypothetical protein
MLGFCREGAAAPRGGMDHDARWLRSSARLVSGMLTTPDDEVVETYGPRIEEGRASADEVRALRRLLVLVAEALTGDAKGRCKRAEMAAQILAGPGEEPSVAATPSANPHVAPVAGSGGPASPREVPSFMANGGAGRWDAGRAPLAGPLAGPTPPAEVAATVGLAAPREQVPPMHVLPAAPPVAVLVPMARPPSGSHPTVDVAAPPEPAPVAPKPAGHTVTFEPTTTSTNQDAPPASALPFRRKRPGKPLSLTEYATIVANLGAAGPARRIETLRAHGFASEDDFMAAARRCQEQILADPSLRARFEDVVAAARSRLS